MTQVVDNKIHMTFGWASLIVNNAIIETVDLVFENAKTLISVNIPKNARPFALQTFSFSCRKENGESFNTPVLNVRLDQMTQLTIKIPNNPEVIRPKISENLQLGQDYILMVQCESENGVTACVVESAHQLDLEEVYEYYRFVLPIQMFDSFQNFKNTLNQRSSKTMVNTSDVQPGNAIFAAIKEVIASIAKPLLGKLATEIRNAKNQWKKDCEGVLTGKYLGSDLFYNCSIQIEISKFEEIMTLSLNQLFIGTIPSDIQFQIYQAAKEFGKSLQSTLLFHQQEKDKV